MKRFFYIVTREELEGLSIPMQNELLSAQVETLGDVLSAKKRKAPEPASGDDAPGELQPLEGFSQQPPPTAASPGPQQAPGASWNTSSSRPTAYPPQQPPAALSQQQHLPQQPPAGFPHQPPPCSSGPDIPLFAGYPAGYPALSFVCKYPEILARPHSGQS
jgi:hypothetical protein